MKFVELPTIAGMVPSLIGDLIDSGMRSGIPSELKVGDDRLMMQNLFSSSPVQRMAFHRGRCCSTRDGRVLYFHDRGFSPLELKKVQALLSGLSERSSEPEPAN